MKFNTKIPKALKPFYQKELQQSEILFSSKNFQESWKHLENAHILGQPYPIEHTATHWKMLVFGIKIKNLREIVGQIPRLVFGGVKSFVGKIPVGNTGGANVPPLKVMEIGEDLKRIIRENS